MYLLMSIISLSLLGACSSDDDDAPATSTGAGTSSGDTTPSTTPTTGKEVKAYGAYSGPTNPDRPTWRWDSPVLTLKDLPSEFTLDIPGCYSDIQVKNNGIRYETNGIVIKQSDGHPGIAVLAPNTCKSTEKAVITYIKK